MPHMAPFGYKNQGIDGSNTVQVTVDVSSLNA